MPRKTRWQDVRQAAITLFASNGYTGASLNQLARECRLSKPGIYYHVRDKEALLLQICESTMVEHLAATRAAASAAGDDAVARLRGVIRAHGTHYFAHWAEHRVLFGQMRYLSPAARRIVVRLERQYLDLVRGIIREGERRGQFRRIDPTVAAFSLFAMLDTIDGWYKRRGRLRPEAIIKEIEELFLGGLVGAGAQSRSARTRAPGSRRNSITQGKQRRARARARRREPLQRRCTARWTCATGPNRQKQRCARGHDRVSNSWVKSG